MGVLLNNWRKIRERARFEDALKHLLSCKHEHRKASEQTLAGELGLTGRKAIRLITRMEAKGLIRARGGTLELTPEGESWALRVVRAHRLWERYLADEANMPVRSIHRAAEAAEHRLTEEEINELDANLGFPATDPHGDPIPTAAGEIQLHESVLLTDWPTNKSARIVHIEDEPEAVFKQIYALGFRPGSVIYILKKTPECLTVSLGENEYPLAPVFAAKIQVTAAAPEEKALPEGTMPLSSIPLDQPVEVIAIDDSCRGLNRRRMLDLGITSGAIVRPGLQSAFGNTRAFNVRGAYIALRKEQADQIWVRHTDEE